jgi:excinuclease ABC subunit B
MYWQNYKKKHAETIDETNYRRTETINYNTENNLIQWLNKKIESAFKKSLLDYKLGLTMDNAAEPETAYLQNLKLKNW